MVLHGLESDRVLKWPESCIFRSGKDFFSGDSPALLAISSSQAVYSKCTTNHTLDLMFCLNCVPQIVPLLCPISSSTRFLLCALILCLCSLHLSPPKAELSGICHTQSNWAHLISISSLHRCTKINHSSPHSAEEELGYGHRTLVCHINQHSTPVPPGLCFHCSQGKDCPPGSSSVQLLAPQDRNIILYSY